MWNSVDGRHKHLDLQHTQIAIVGLFRVSLCRMFVSASRHKYIFLSNRSTWICLFDFKSICLNSNLYALPLTQLSFTFPSRTRNRRMATTNQPPTTASFLSRLMAKTSASANDVINFVFSEKDVALLLNPADNKDVMVIDSLVRRLNHMTIGK